MYKKEKNFFKAQLRHIRRGGIRLLVHKLLIVLLLPVTLPMAIMMRLLSPFILIRIIPLITSRMGHLSVDTEGYLCERDAGFYGKRTIDIFYHIPPVCNLQLKKMVERLLFIFPPASFLDRANRLLPGWEKYTMHISLGARTRDLNCFFARTPTHFYLTAQEQEEGRQGLRELGIAEDAPYVCFYARDAMYLRETMPKYDWGYHSYRDSQIANYIPAVEELTRRGYFAVRMGYLVEKPLKTSNPKIIDYSTNGRSDFLDVYLGTRCRFFISSASGLSGIPIVFRIPIVWVNFIPFEYIHSWAKTDIVIPKRLWLPKERRFMKFSEIIKSGAGNFHYAPQYKKLGIEPVENTPEEIKAVSLEMDDRLNGRFETTKEDEELQRRFWSVFKGSPAHGQILSRVGRDFLRENVDLLD